MLTTFYSEARLWIIKFKTAKISQIFRVAKILKQICNSRRLKEPNYCWPHMWVEFVVASRHCSEGFPPFTKKIRLVVTHAIFMKILSHFTTTSKRIRKSAAIYIHTLLARPHGAFQSQFKIT